jgi:hypothetical protein
MFGPITGLTGLRYITLLGQNIVGGVITFLVLLDYVSISGSNTIGGLVTSLVLLVRLVLTGNTTVSGSLTLLVLLERLDVQGSNTIGGLMSNLVNLLFVFLTGNTIVSGNVPAAPNCTQFYVYGSNTLTNTVSGLTSATYLFIGQLAGVGNTVTYATYVWPANMQYFRTQSISVADWSIADITQAIADGSLTNWGGFLRFDLSTHSDMADVNQGGIWGDFSGPDLPSVLATNMKTLGVTRGVTNFSLNGIVLPGGAGDGTGFPPGFGDWWRI